MAEVPYKELSKEERFLQQQISRNFRIATTALVLALLLAAALTLGLALYYNDRVGNAESALRASATRISNVEMQLLEVVMNATSATPVYTTRLEGTFDWVVQANSATTIPGSTYRLRDVAIGPLNFTVLELSAPTAPYVFPATVATSYRFWLQNFVPALYPTPLFQGDSSNGYPLTQTNFNRVSISGGCLQAATCVLDAENGDGSVPNTVVFRNTGLTPADMQIQFYVRPVGAVVGQTFGLSESWMFLIPSF